MSDFRRPAAVLLDFGGVLVQGWPRESAYQEVAAEIDALLTRACGESPGLGQVEADLRAAMRAWRDWKNAQSRRARPREINHREFWEDFVAADWPLAARSVVVAHASDLCQRVDLAMQERTPTDGALELLQRLAALGIRTGCVSNALAGSGSRILMRQYGFEAHLGVQIYSDEVGVRKPNPEIFELATTALNVSPAECWYVGDKRDRDVLGARRAGIARVILMPSGDSDQGPLVTADPDHVIQSPLQLLDLLCSERS